MPELSTAEISTAFTGNITDLQAKAKQAEQIAAQTATAMTASLSKGGGFSGITQSVTGASAAFQNFGSTVTTTFNQVGAEFQKLPTKAKPPLDEVAQAFKQLGVKSQASLEQTAAEAQKAFETLKTSGKASAQDLVRAQKSVDDALAKTRIKVEETGKAFKQAETHTRSFGDRMKSLGSSLTQVGVALSIAITAPLVLMGKRALEAGSSFESAFAGVRKTVDATEPQLAQLREGFRRMALEIPVTANELAKIAEAAGALGVKTEDILGFTRVMADLGVTTNLTSDQAATGLARLANIMQSEAGPQFSQMAAALVALGNAGASTESEILEMSLRIALSGKQAGLSKADILALANALSSIGIEAEAGGSAISRAFTIMADATKKGGKELQIFALTASQSAVDFKKSFETDAAGAMISFISGLQQTVDKGKSVTPILAALGLEGLRVRQSLTGAASAGDLFNESIKLGSKAFEENVAHTKEAAERYKTFDSQLQLVKNQLTDIAINIFDKLRPALTGMLDTIKGAIGGFADLDARTITMGATFLAIAGTAGPIALLAGKLLQFGPKGAIVAAVIAGTAAMAAAYASDYAAMNQTVTNHSNLLGKLLGSGSQSQAAMGSFSEMFEVGVAGWIDLIERFFVVLERAAVKIVTFAEVSAAALSLQWDKIPAIEQKGQERLALIDETFATNRLARDERINEIQRVVRERTWTQTVEAAKKGWETFQEVSEQGGAAGALAFAQGFVAKHPEVTIGDVITGLDLKFQVVLKGVGQTGAQSLNDAFNAGLSQKNPITNLLDVLKRGEGPVRTQSSKIGSILGYGLKLGHDSEVFKSPYFALDVLDKALAGMGESAKKGKKHGAALGKALLDGFKEGVAGLDQAMEFLNEKAGTKAGFGGLFDKIAKSAQDGARITVSALKVAADAINEFLSTGNINVKFSAEDVFKKWDISGPLRASAQAFAHLKDAIAQINIDRVLQGFNALDDAITFDNKNVKLAVLTYEELRAKFPQVVAEIEKLGRTIEGTLPKQVSVANSVKLAMEAGSIANKKILDDIANAHEDSAARAKAAWDALVAQLPINKLKAALKEIKDVISGSDFFNATRLQNEAAAAFDGVIREAQELGERLGENQTQINKRILDTVGVLKERMPAEFKQIGDKTINAAVDALNPLPGALDKIFNKVLDGLGILSAESRVRIKGFAADIIGVFDTLPGKWGDSLRKALDEVNKWINFLDSAMKLIQRMMGGESGTGLAGIFSNLDGVFKNTTQSASSSVDKLKAAGGVFAEFGDEMSKSSQDTERSVSGAFEAMTIAVSGFISGMTIGAATGSRAIGALGGAAMGALQGFMAGGPLGAVIGGVAGLIGGIFGGGKSAAQKKAEEDAARAASVSMQETSQRIANAALDGMLKGFEVLEKLDEFNQVRKAKFAGFFSNMKRLMDGFVSMARQWSVESLAQAKAAADAIGPVADAISRLPDAFAAINGHFSTAQASIDSFFADFSTVMTAFFVRSEVWIDGISKRAMKVADRLTPVVSLISGFAAAITDIGKVEEPNDSIWGIFDRTIESIVSHVAALADKFEKSVLKVMANFAEKSGGALDLFKTGVETIKAMVDIPVPSAQDFANVFSGIETVITQMAGLSERVSAEAMAKASAMATASLSIFASIKAGVEALSSLRDFKDVLPEIFGQFRDDFFAAIGMLQDMATRGAMFESVSKTFESYIAGGAASLSHAFTMLSQIMNAAGAFFPGGTPLVVPVPVPSLASGGDIQSSGLAFVHAGERVIPAGTSQGTSQSIPFAPPATGRGGSVTNIYVGDTHVSGDSREGKAYLKALQELQDLVRPGGGLDQAIGQHGG